MKAGKISRACCLINLYCKVVYDGIMNTHAIDNKTDMRHLEQIVISLYKLTKLKKHKKVSRNISATDGGIHYVYITCMYLSFTLGRCK